MRANRYVNSIVEELKAWQDGGATIWAGEKLAYLAGFLHAENLIGEDHRDTILYYLRHPDKVPFNSRAFYREGKKKLTSQ